MNIVALSQPLNEGDVLKHVVDEYERVYINTVHNIGNVEYNSLTFYNFSTASATESFQSNKLYNSEGYARDIFSSVTNPDYYYFCRDHLGNIREVWQGYRRTVVQRTQYYPSGLPWASNSSDNPSLQSRKYNGKEFVEMHGLDEYDSEARWYYPAIMRTTTIDPLAEKYYSISPYAWCGNNPVKYIDPDGRWITIYHGTSAYRYDNGKLYKEDTVTNSNGNTVTQLNEYTPDEGSFLGGVLNALNKIYNSGSAGQELLSFFANDMNTADIFETDKGNHISTVKNSGNPIYLNSDLNGSPYIPTTSGLQTSPFFIDTAHELAHRRDFIQNPDKIADIWYLLPKYPGFNVALYPELVPRSYERTDILQTEKNAMHTENLIRLDSNLPLRTHYQNYEPSRVVDLINGKYVNVHNNYIYK